MPDRYFYSLKMLAVLFLLGYYCTSSHAQDQARVDSLLALLPAKDDTTSALIYQDLQSEYRPIDLEKCKLYLDKQIEYSRKSGSDRFLMESYFSEGVYYHELGDYAKAEAKYVETERYLDPKKDGPRLAKLYLALANTAGGQGQYELSVERGQKSIDLILAYDLEPKQLARGYNLLGKIYGVIENWELSDMYLRKAIRIHEQSGNVLEAMTDSMTLAINLIDQQRKDEAKPILEVALDVFAEAGDEGLLTQVYSNLGNIEQHGGSLKKAEELYKKGLELAENTGRLDDYVMMNTRLAAVYGSTGREREAIIILKELAEVNATYGDTYMQQVIYGELEENYRSLGNYAEAYDYLQQYSILQDSLMSIDKVNTINELEVRYQTEKREQEIKLLEEKAKRNSLEKKGMVGGIIGLLGLFGAVFYAMRQRMTKNRLAKETVDQKLAFSIKELELKKQELTAYALQLAHKNEVLEGIKSNVNEIKVGNDSNRDLQKIVNTIDINQNDDESWDGFRSRFLAVHKDFEVNVKSTYPAVTVNELRLMALLKMQLTSKEIANILNISAEGIKKARYRLRKKLGLASADSLEELILSIA